MGVGDGEGVGVGVGVAEQRFAGEMPLRGEGVLEVKLLALSPVSVQPSALRRGAAVLPEAGARPEPSKQAAAEP